MTSPTPKRPRNPRLGLLLVSQSLSGHVCPWDHFQKALPTLNWTPRLLTIQIFPGRLPLKGVTRSQPDEGPGTPLPLPPICAWGSDCAEPDVVTPGLRRSGPSLRHRGREAPLLSITSQSDSVAEEVTPQCFPAGKAAETEGLGTPPFGPGTEQGGSDNFGNKQLHLRVRPRHRGNLGSRLLQKCPKTKHVGSWVNPRGAGGFCSVSKRPPDPRVRQSGARL